MGEECSMHVGEAKRHIRFLFERMRGIYYVHLRMLFKQESANVDWFAPSEYDLAADCCECCDGDSRLCVVLQLGRDSKRVDCVPMTGLVPWNWAAAYIAGFLPLV
jgi:hypothetical protein